MTALCVNFCYRPISPGPALIFHNLLSHTQLAQSWRASDSSTITSTCPSTGSPLATIVQGSVEDYEACMSATVSARKAWGA